MKIATRDIEPLVKSPKGHNAVFLYGPDEGLVRHRAQLIAEAWLGDGADATAQMSLTGDQIKEDPARLLDELQSLSLMGDKRVIMLRDPAESIAQTVADGYGAASEENRFLVLAGNLTNKSNLRSAAEKHPDCACIPCYSDEGRGLEALIRTTLTGYGLRADSQAMAYLNGHLNGDRMIVLGQLEKLSLYMGEEEQLTLEILQEVIGESNERSMDDLCYAVSGGDKVQAMRLLDRMWQQNTAPIVILRSLQRHFGRFRELDQLAAQGFRGEEAVKKLRPMVFFKYQRAMAQHATRWRSKKLASALQILQKTESDCKSTSSAVELLCAQAVLQLTQAA